MDITQILITVGSIVGILLVALIAIVPTAMEIPSAEALPKPDRETRPTRPIRKPSVPVRHLHAGV